MKVGFEFCHVAVVRLGIAAPLVRLKVIEVSLTTAVTMYLLVKPVTSLNSIISFAARVKVSAVVRV